MTHVRVTQDMRYEKNWMCKVVLSPGVYSCAFIKSMVDEEFLRDRLGDGTLLPVNPEEMA